MHPSDKDLLLEAHRPRWTTFSSWAALFFLLILAEGFSIWTVLEGQYIWTAMTIFLVAHLMHSQLLAFHEAAHGSLCPSRWLNEGVGILIGNTHFIGLSLFRAVHHSHHAWVGSERDDELWPFVDARTPRWARRLAAACELTMAMIFDAVKFWRPFLRKNSPIRNPAVRRRIWIEQSCTAVFWVFALLGVASYDAWHWLLVLFLIPAILAGNMHALRKYIEHMGMTGKGSAGLSRTVVPTGPLGRLFAFTLFNVTYHGVHHCYGRLLPGARPRFVGLVEADQAQADNIYPDYLSALRAMLATLADPKIGSQWNVQAEEARKGATPRARVSISA